MGGPTDPHLAGPAVSSAVAGEGSPPLEIERVFLLRGLPPLPDRAEAHRLEQGYLDDPLDDSTSSDAGTGESGFREGRVRRWTGPDGVVRCFHTVKRGRGIVREETERIIDEGEFDRAWARTGRRRIAKTRYRIPEGDLVWEVDRFDDLPLVMAEVELPAVDHPVEVPAWMEGWIVREISEDPRYRNSELARGIADGTPLPPLA